MSKYYKNSKFSPLSHVNLKESEKEAILHKLKFQDDFAIFAKKAKAEAAKDLKLMEAEKARGIVLGTENTVENRFIDDVRSPQY